MLMNPWDVILVLLIAAAVCGALRSILRQRREGNACCGSGCSGSCGTCNAACSSRKETGAAGRPAGAQKE